MFIASLGLVFHLIRSPQWVWEDAFQSNPPRSGVRPLFGWTGYTIALLLPVTVAGIAKLVNVVLTHLHMSWWAHLLLFPLGVVCVPLGLGEGLIFFLKISNAEKSEPVKKRSGLMNFFLGVVSANLDITQGLLHPYQIQRALYDLFVKDAPDFVILKDKALNATKVRVKALFVCAALEETEQIGLSDDMSVVDALTAAVAVPGLLPPRIVSREWVATATKTSPVSFKVIDGAAVRSNPIPAFFSWARTQSETGDRQLIEKLERPDVESPSLHVVYAVPTGYDGSIQDAPGMECPDIVTSAQKAIQMAKRRDTRQEVRQTNTLSRLEWVRRSMYPLRRTGHSRSLQMRSHRAKKSI